MEWKRPLLIGVGWGLGTVVGLAVLLGGFLWYRSRPKPPKPWNTSAVKAEYDLAETEGDSNTIVVRYTLENTTEFDYRAYEGQDVMMSSKLKEQKSLLPTANLLKIDYPIFVPAKKRVDFKVHIAYPCPEKEKPEDDADQRKKYHQAVEKYMEDKFGNLDGFDLLDETKRYEIIFPAGWKHSAKQAESH